MIKLYSALAILAFGGTVWAQDTKTHTTKDGVVSFRVPSEWRRKPLTNGGEEVGHAFVVKGLDVEYFLVWSEKGGPDLDEAIAATAKKTGAVKSMRVVKDNTLPPGVEGRFAVFMTSKDWVGMARVVRRQGVTYYFHWKCAWPRPERMAGGAALFQSIRLNEK